MVAPQNVLRCKIASDFPANNRIIHPRSIRTINDNMTWLWIPLTIGAAFLQNVRSSLQKHLKGELGTTGATFIRFGYGFPFAILYLLALVTIFNFDIPSLNTTFLYFVVTGGIAQIAGTAFLLTLFDKRNFAVGTAYSKTETVQAAIFAIMFLGETISATATIGILISLVGVMAISAARGAASVASIAKSWTARPALIGIASGASFGIAAVSYRGASLSLGGDGFLVQAAFTLAFVLVLQTLVMAIYMIIRDPGEIRRVIAAWRLASLVGASGALGSIGWFTAMTIQNAALVRALGQIELVFTIGVSVLIFREKIVRLELAGIALVIAGIIVLVLR